MIALSIRQPWAWLIMEGGKDIENRDWPTQVRGRVLIHASKQMTREEYDSGINYAKGARNELRGRGITLAPITSPGRDHLSRGGIIGSVEIVDCVSDSTSPWFMGRFGFVLRDPRPMPFMPYKGQLGFFKVPEIAS